MRRYSIVFLVQGGLIAALYVALTWLSTIFQLSSFAIQVRLSEALAILPAFTPAAIPGLTVGCIISNLMVPGVHPLDILGGSFATLLGAVCCYLISRLLSSHEKAKCWMSPLPNFAFNTVIVPFVLKFAYQLPEGYFFLMFTVGAGEFVAGCLLGWVLYRSIYPIKSRIFITK